MVVGQCSRQSTVESHVEELGLRVSECPGSWGNSMWFSLTVCMRKGLWVKYCRVAARYRSLVKRLLKPTASTLTEDFLHLASALVRVKKFDTTLALTIQLLPRPPQIILP